ncbi:MAG: hypothetical protein K1X64_22595 [Myxococcaceae bacterium]|nr:hypothetical protein [Myxococcaceae bacterium]
MKALFAAALVFSLGLMGCEPPMVYSTADRRQNTALSRIEGEVVITGKARGAVVLFLFDATRPPPPVGTGRPVSLTVVPRDDVFAGSNANDTGPFVARYAFSLVPPGKYTVRGFIDTNADFVPWYSVTSEVNGGDVGGAAIDVATGASRVIDVSAEQPTVVDVPVSFSDTATVTVDRPAFSESTGNPTITVTASGGNKVFDINATPLNTGIVHEGKPAFLVKAIDDNKDGVPDDTNGDGLPDVWPKIFVRKLSDLDNPLADENDVDRNGVLDANGADYEHVNPLTGTTIPADGQPDAVVLAAGIDLTDILPLVLEPGGAPKPQPTAVASLHIVMKPLAIDVSNPRAPAPLRALPKGRYALTVMQFTGQTWRVPNELAPGVSERFGLPTVASQAFVIQVP